MPPHSWDNANLVHNLGVLASLSNAAQGSKLAYDSSTGRFTTQKPGLGQSILRTFSSNSVEKEDTFATPVVELFNHARPAIGQNVTQKQFTDALNGLKSLRASYSGTKDKQQRKLKALNQVIHLAEFGVPLESTWFSDFRTTYQRYLIYSARMGPYLKDGDLGICQAFAIDWCRRILNKKPTYAHSKHGKLGADVQPSFEEHQRMRKKVTSRLLGFQKQLDEGEGTTGGKYRQGFQGSYANIRLQPYLDGGEIQSSDTGADLFSHPLKRANVYCPLFLLNFHTAIEKIEGSYASDGHAIGVDLTGEGVHLFDSNVGEFHFPPGSEKVLAAFANELWNGLYTGDYERWSLTWVSPYDKD